MNRRNRHARQGHSEAIPQDSIHLGPGERIRLEDVPLNGSAGDKQVGNRQYNDLRYLMASSNQALRLIESGTLTFPTTTTGTVTGTRWVENFIIRTFSGNLTFLGATSGTTRRWDIVETVPGQNTLSVKTAGESNTPIKLGPTLGALVVFEILWDQNGIVFINTGSGEASFIDTKFKTATQGPSINTYACIWRQKPIANNTYLFKLDYLEFSSGVYAEFPPRNGKLHVSFVMDVDNTIAADRIQFVTDTQDSAEGDFVLIQNGLGEVELYHRRNSFWPQLEFRVTIHYSTVYANSFLNGSVHTDIDLSAGFQSVPMAGGITEAGAGLSIDGSGRAQLGGSGGVSFDPDVNLSIVITSPNANFSSTNSTEAINDSSTVEITANNLANQVIFSGTTNGITFEQNLYILGPLVGGKNGFEFFIDTNLSNSSFKFYDKFSSKGLEYAGDYESNFTARSLVTKQYVDGAISGSAHNPVTIGSPANGLSISGTQVLSIGLASTSATGALSSTDWNTFNNKLNLTSPITGYTVGANTALAATDTILQAFGKVQGQVNARISGTIASGQVAFGTGLNTIGGSSKITWNNTNGELIISNKINLGNGFEANLTNPEINLSGGSSSSFNTNYLSQRAGFFYSDINRTIFGEFRNVFLEFRVNNLEMARLTSSFFGLFTNNPTNPLDVNGTVRIRSTANLGTAATSVLVPSATGVVSLRTLAEFRSDLGATTLGANLFTIPNPSAITFPRFNADNTISALTSSGFRTAIGAVPTTRTLTINGVAQDLSADRSWTIPTHDAVTLGTANGLSLVGQALSLGLASSGVTGALSGTDWNTFNGKQNAISGTQTEGFVATIVGGVPTWAVASGGGAGAGAGLSLDGSDIRLGDPTGSTRVKFLNDSASYSEFRVDFLTDKFIYGGINVIADNNSEYSQSFLFTQKGSDNSYIASHVDVNGGFAGMTVTTTGSAQVEIQLSSLNGARILDSIFEKGLEEIADYSANKTDYSYITPAWMKYQSGYNGAVAQYFTHNAGTFEWVNI